jgi:hypothetical protein
MTNITITPIKIDKPTVTNGNPGTANGLSGIVSFPEFVPFVFVVELVEMDEVFIGSVVVGVVCSP